MRPAPPAFTPGPVTAVTVPAGSAYNPPGPALRAVFATQAAGIPLLPRDLPPDLVAHIPQCWAQLQAAQQPVTEGHVAAWLKKLAHLVTTLPALPLRQHSAAPFLMCVRTFPPGHGANPPGWHGCASRRVRGTPLAHAGPARTNSAPFCFRLPTPSGGMPQPAKNS